MVPIPSYDTIVAQVLAFFRNRFPGKDTHTESFLGKAARALARTISYLLVSLQSVDQDAVPSLKTSFTALVNMAFAYGVPSNTGGFGANGATPATGGIATFTGTNGTIFLDGTQMTGPDNVTLFKLSGSVTIPGVPPGSGSIPGNVIAVTAGSAGNLGANQQLTLLSPPSGGDGTATLTTGLGGGLDSETAQSLLSRILSRWQNPPKGGAAVDYRTWAETISGVYRAYVYPNREGANSVDVLITASGSGPGRRPSSTVQTNVSNYINGNASPLVLGQRPVSSLPANVLLPNVSLAGLAIRIRVTVSQSKYAFDWSLGTAAFTVASYAAGIITMNQALPTTLTQKVDAYLASPSTVTPPRLQVVSSGMAAPGINPPVYVVNYNAGAKTLTLQTPLPSGWATPNSGDSVFPYGNVVPIVAQGANPSTAIGGIQGYVDLLGPSRAGGYANPLDSWNDVASFIAIGQTAIDATDTDGVTKPVARVLSATINGASADVQATDTLAGGVQLLTCASIAVTD